ncbi:glutamine-hydrolyzing carbamoyl-phosphate synthase small subunit [Sulfuriroseicoccus oceanibius]|uniref:Carbamoyl phosphate synthase small chain n=1 Tax=Sulfuriroseicoccus oceanibius TaxID=2707525 RepID=A0A6B3L8X6_9BACT|nr:glutamine-hydrolyzing carbamoyl-phosphate synthase small subunit [Sulfuriroseicoccus oceanibius]QQL44377.1 glutamine-hydrolyzing carbamoyl-phosphate synthase small subunit [Sulfuriroseicoccus oceanibius]
MSQSHPAILALEDGTFFEGEAYGALDTVHVGEICFNTSMTGYQEVLTDPSYRGQIVSMTYTQIGNYGCNPADFESNEPHVRGFVIEELCKQPSNFRSVESLDAFLKRHDIPGIQGVDTRALTKKLRTAGAMRAVIATKAMTAEEAVELAKNSPGMEGMDYVKEVTTPDIYKWDPENKESREWTIPNPSLDDERAAKLEEDDNQVFQSLAPVRHHIVAYDFGIKRNILRRLRQAGFAVTVVPATTKAEDVLALNPDGVFLSNGPGDPAALDYVHTEVAKLIDEKPIFAICLGHQIISHAVGGKTFKLKFGHRGGNQPVKDLRTGKISITSQNHGFAVDGDSLPDNVEVTHVNLNDETVEGLRLKDKPVFSVQYHPEAAPGPNDASYFFDEFAALIDSTKG